MPGQRNWIGMDCSLLLPAQELEAIDEGTKCTTDNRMRFLEIVEECGRNKTLVDGCILRRENLFVESY